uniref:MADF domain-containing protein n=1 Tax=Knipowitschia caucasica TaxID=637954 RepID=A0AAV2MI42_KNICA
MEAFALPPSPPCLMHCEENVRQSHFAPGLLRRPGLSVLKHREGRADLSNAQYLRAVSLERSHSRVTAAGQSPRSLAGKHESLEPLVSHCGHVCPHWQAVKELGLEGKVTHKQVSKKWENLKKRYKGPKDWLRHR